MLFLKKNDKYVEGGNLPYFRLAQAPDKEKGETEWREVAAFWLKEKEGKKYYTGKPAKGVEISFEAKPKVEEINADDIKFD